MVKSKDSGASRSSSSTRQTRTTTATQAVQGGALSGGVAGGAAPSQQTAQQDSQGGKPTINATQMTRQEFMQEYNAQNPTRAQKSASYDYTYPYSRDGTGYSPSQTMNYKLDTGQRLTSKEQRMLDGMEQMQAPLKHDTILSRGAHKNVLESLGIQNYDTMTQSQLRQALVGRQWTTKSLSSTSYDYNASPFLGTGPLAGGREVVMKLNVAKGTMATRVNPSQAEVVLGRGCNFQITGVRYTGGTANPRATWRPGGWPVVELEIDVW